MQRGSRYRDRPQAQSAEGRKPQLPRVFRVAAVSIIALSSGRCDCAHNEGPANLTACSHVTNAKKDLQTFVQNHPINGSLDPQSQVAVLAHMIAELKAGQAEGPEANLSNELGLTINDATQVQADIAAGKRVTSAALISDFNNLESMCGQFGGSDITSP